MKHIFELLESQGYRHGGPIRYFDTGGGADGSGGPDGPAGGGDGGGDTSHDTSPQSERGPLSGDAFSNLSTPDVGRIDAGGTTSTNGDDGGVTSEPAADRSFAVSTAPAAYANVKPGEDAFAQYGATTGTNIHNQAEQAQTEGTTLASILGREPNYGELSQLSDSGMGTMEGVNPNNPTQSVNQMLATQDLASFTDKYAIPALTALVPNFALAYNLAKVASGDITVGQALTSFATSYAAKALNVAPSVLSSMIAGNFGQAAASQALGSVTAGVAKAAHIPGALAAFGVKESGAGQAISSAVNGAVGNTGMGISQDSIAKSIDSAVSGIGGAITGSPTTAGTTGTGAQPLSLDPVDNILNSSSNTPSLGDILPGTTAPAARPAAVASNFALPVNTAATTPYNGAEINYLYDVGGSDIFAPQKAGTPKPDVLKYLQNNVATAAQGGSITDLLDYVRK